MIRSGSVVDNRLSGQVARIGKGWASLADRAFGSHPELLPMLPATTRLTSKSYILNIASDTDELPVEAEELFDTRREMHDPTAEWLSGLSPTLLDHWLGMWERIDQKGPAWQSQAAHCAVEFLAELLRVLAPTEHVVDWQVAQGKYGDLYLPQGHQQPQYLLRMFYIGAVFGVSRFTVEGLFSAVPKAIKCLQKIKHTSYADEEFETWIAATSEVVAVLVPNRPT